MVCQENTPQSVVLQCYYGIDLLVRKMRSLYFLLIASLLVSLKAPAQTDSSPHRVQFVPVEEDVQLEVLDWGGLGRPLIFLAGAGDTAHAFDNFAPKFTGQNHVYGITRKGSGASSKPAPANGNYSADRLGDDVLAVMQALRIERPVLVGHSIAGEELSSIGSRFPNKVSGLIYLDAIASWSFYDPAHPQVEIETNGIKKRIEEIEARRRSDRTRVDARDPHSRKGAQSLPTERVSSVRGFDPAVDWSRPRHCTERTRNSNAGAPSLGCHLRPSENWTRQGSLAASPRARAIRFAEQAPSWHADSRCSLGPNESRWRAWSVSAKSDLWHIFTRQ